MSQHNLSTQPMFAGTHRTIRLAIYLTTTAMLTGAAWAETPGSSLARSLLKTDSRQFRLELDRRRPLPVSAEAREQVLNSLPAEGHVQMLTDLERVNLSSLHAVFASHHRESVYELRIIDVPEAFVGLHARSVLLISRTALALVTADELQALAAHEIGHEYVWEEYEVASTQKASARLQELELYGDAVAIITLRGLGRDPSRITTATEKIGAYNRMHFGIALNEYDYPTIAERKKFARVIIGWTHAF